MLIQQSVLTDLLLFFLCRYISSKFQKLQNDAYGSIDNKLAVLRCVPTLLPILLLSRYAQGHPLLVRILCNVAWKRCFSSSPEVWEHATFGLVRVTPICSASGWHCGNAPFTAACCAVSAYNWTVHLLSATIQAKCMHYCVLLRSGFGLWRSSTPKSDSTCEGHCRRRLCIILTKQGFLMCTDNMQHMDVITFRLH